MATKTVEPTKYFMTCLVWMFTLVRHTKAFTPAYILVKWLLVVWVKFRPVIGYGTSMVTKPNHPSRSVNHFRTETALATWGFWLKNPPIFSATRSSNSTVARVFFSHQLSQLLRLQLLGEVAQGLTQGLLPWQGWGWRENIGLKLDLFMKCIVLYL